MRDQIISYDGKREAQEPFASASFVAPIFSAKEFQIVTCATLSLSKFVGNSVQRKLFDEAIRNIHSYGERKGRLEAVSQLLLRLGQALNQQP